MRFMIIGFITAMLGFVSVAHGGYARAGWTAVMPVAAHDAQGRATILDERTIRVDRLIYDGTAPLVYLYLGATNSSPDFVAGIPIGPLLDREYVNECLTVSLPVGQSLDGYGAISVWCEQFSVNFSSAAFVAPTEPPYERAEWRATLPPGAHQSQCVATILDVRTLCIEHFTYDGTAPAVYFYLGATDTQDDFVNGKPIAARLNLAYNDESLTLTLPENESLDGYGALSIWCAAVNANFTSASFQRVQIPGDCDGDNDVDQEDFGHFQRCLGLGVSEVPASPAECIAMDFTGNGTIDQDDFGVFQACMSSPGVPGDPTCADD